MEPLNLNFMTYQFLLRGGQMLIGHVVSDDENDDFIGIINALDQFTVIRRDALDAVLELHLRAKT